MSSFFGPTIPGKRCLQRRRRSPAASSTDSVVCVTYASLLGIANARAAARRRPTRRGGCRRRTGPSCPRPPDGPHGRSSRSSRPCSRILATSTWTLVTSGHVASNTRSPRASASARTAFDTPCAENTTVAPAGTSSSSSTNTAPFALQVVDDEPVVHDLVAHVDRRAELRERLLDDRDRAVDAGAEAARIGEQRRPSCVPVAQCPRRIGAALRGSCRGSAARRRR